jgi:hypothetical protein
VELGGRRDLRRPPERRQRLPEHDTPAVAPVGETAFLTEFLQALAHLRIENVADVREQVVLYHPAYTWGYAFYQVLTALNTWAWLMAILGCGHRWLDFSNAGLTYAGEAVLPFYILHDRDRLAIARDRDRGVHHGHARVSLRDPPEHAVARVAGDEGCPSARQGTS